MNFNAVQNSINDILSVKGSTLSQGTKGSLVGKNAIR